MAVAVLLVVVLQLPVYVTDAVCECNCKLNLWERNARPYRLLLRAWRPGHKVFEHMKKAVKIDRNTVLANIQIMTNRSLCMCISCAYLGRFWFPCGFTGAGVLYRCVHNIGLFGL